MATIYVRKTGNDTTGDGSTGNPYLTIDKARAVAASGDTILVGTGTYAENTSGNGYLYWNRQFSSWTFVEPETGVLGDVIITGTSGTARDMQIGPASYTMFRNIVFRSRDNTVTVHTQFANQNINNLRFINCRWEVLGKSGQFNGAINSAWSVGSGGAYAISAVAFAGCEVRQIGPDAVYGVNLSSQLGFVSDLRFVDFKAHVGYFPFYMGGVLDFRIHGMDLLSFGTTVAGTAFQIGEDAATGYNTRGIATRIKAVAMTGHAAVIGGGVSDIQLDDSQFFGGEHTANGQGLVVKNATGGRISRSTVYGGYLSGLYLKACSNVLFDGVHVYNRFATSAALRAGINPENNSKIANNTIRGCRFHAPIGSAISWDSAAGDDGGNVVDQNGYYVSGTGTYGTVRAAVVGSLSALREAWSGYDRPYNDSTSRIGRNAVLHAGDRTVALA